MPYKPKRPCRYPGCSRLAVGDGQYCAEHQKVAHETYKKFERNPDINKTYGRSWKRIRDRYAAEHPLCVMCLREGRLTPVQEVHHILPVEIDGPLGRPPDTHQQAGKRRLAGSRRADDTQHLAGFQVDGR